MIFIVFITRFRRMASGHGYIQCKLQFTMVNTVQVAIYHGNVNTVQVAIYCTKYSASNNLSH